MVMLLTLVGFIGTIEVLVFQSNAWLKMLNRADFTVRYEPSLLFRLVTMPEPWVPVVIDSDVGGRVVSRVGGGVIIVTVFDDTAEPVVTVKPLH